MALSDREQRLLDELERGLYESDANFASKLGNGPTRTPAKLIAGLSISLIGVSLIIFAVMIQVAFFGVFAFLVMLAGLVVASSNLNPKPGPGHNSPRAGAGKSNQKASESLRNIFEDRWNKRQGE
jgi:ABC-type multidrug transport system fused ATPase/permease subunit